MGTTQWIEPEYRGKGISAKMMLLVKGAINHRYLGLYSSIAILKGDTESRKYYSNRYNTILSHKKEIEKCREQHKIKQANWL